MGYESNPDWYRTKHALAAECVSWAAGESDTEAMSLLDRAEQCVSELLGQVDAMLGPRTGDRRERNAGGEALRSFLADDVAPTARVLLLEIDAAKQSREAGSKSEVTVEIVRDLSRKTSNPDVNYALARLAAQIAAKELTGESLRVVVEGTKRMDWPGLAHKIARDPVLAEVDVPADFHPEEEIRTLIQEASSVAQKDPASAVQEVSSAAQKSAEESQGLD